MGGGRVLGCSPWDFRSFLISRGAPALVESSTDGPAEEDTIDEQDEEEGADALGAPASAPLFSGTATFGLSTPVLLTGGGAVVLAVGATITGIMALGAQNDFEAAVDIWNDPTVEQMQRELVRQEGYDHASRADTLAAVTDVLIAATAVSAGAAVALWWLERPDSESASGGMSSEDLDDSELDLSRNVHPWATPSAAGLMIHGSF